MSSLSPLKYLLPRPDMGLSRTKRNDIRDVLSKAREQAGVPLIDYAGVPKWQLLCEFADGHGLMLHGTSDPEIDLFVPRQPVDANPFGAQKAVYAASDGIWPMFYAILDRSKPFSLHNSCIRFLDGHGGASDPYYFFSISRSALETRPFQPGFVYLLPGETFFADPQTELNGLPITVAHYASLEAVRPIAKVRVEPPDFPFLGSIRGHDDESLFKRIEQEPNGFPWVDEPNG